MDRKKLFKYLIPTLAIVIAIGAYFVFKPKELSPFEKAAQKLFQNELRQELYYGLTPQLNQHLHLKDLLISVVTENSEFQLIKNTKLENDQYLLAYETKTFELNELTAIESYLLSVSMTGNRLDLEDLKKDITQQLPNQKKRILTNQITAIYENQQLNKIEK